MKKLDWVSLKSHLDAVGLNATSLQALLGYVRRQNSLIMPYPNPSRELERGQFFDALREHVSKVSGAEAVALLDKEFSLLQKIENGYRSLLGVLDRCDISKIPAASRISACIARAAEQFKILKSQITEELIKRNSFGLYYGAIPIGDDRVRVNPEAAFHGLVSGITSTVIMEALKNNWAEPSKIIVLPNLPVANEAERYQAGSVEVLALFWMHWKRTEERRRYLGGAFEEILPPKLAGNAEGFKRLTIYKPDESEYFDFIANERLGHRLSQMYLDMLVQTNVESKVSGIHNDVSLPPGVAVSIDEAHALVALSEILSYPITEDCARHEGLRLVEWLRGYSVLKVLAQEREKEGECIFSASRGKITSLIKKCGLSADAAIRFIDAVTLRTTSRDLFDCPLIQLASGALLVFSPALIGANHASIILSVLSADKSLSQKGKAFEKAMRAFLEGAGLQPKSFKFRLGSEEYEYDMVLPWGDYLFVFECKNRSLSGNYPIQAHHFQMELRSHTKQLLRLVEGLRQAPGELAKHCGNDAVTKEIIPCLLHALPYSMPGRVDGVYFTDSSTLTRFFSDRNFNVKVAHQVSDSTKLLHRTAVHSMWKGDRPTPEDLIHQLDHSFQLRLLEAHVEPVPMCFELGSGEHVASIEFSCSAITVESFSKVAGADPEVVKKSLEKAAVQIDQLRAALKKKAGD